MDATARCAAISRATLLSARRVRQDRLGSEERRESQSNEMNDPLHTPHREYGLQQNRHL